MPPSPPVADARNPLSIPDYRRYWLSRVATNVAMQVQVVAVGWQMYELTGSAMALGLVGLVQFAPSAALTFVVGPVVDRYDRRRILMICRTVQGSAALALALASLLGHLDTTLLYTLVFVLGAVGAFEMPAGQALLPSLVPDRLLSRAVALGSSAHQAATIGGPALGGLLYVAGAHAVYATSAALFLTSLALLARVRVRPRPAERPKITLAYLLAGIVFIGRHPVLLGAVSLDLFAVLLGGATALLPIYAKDILNTGAWGLGLLRSAPAVGALAVALWLARRPLERRVGRLLLAAVAAFGVATIVFGLSRWLPLSFAALVVLGAADMISVVIRVSLVQLETPDAMRGRVGAVTALFIGASNQIGEFESGLVAAWLGAMPSVVLGGVGTLLVVLAWWRLFPALARRDRIGSRPAGG
jgi:MFS family permease